MNYCRKCQSDYEKPGTCNCFAETEPRQARPFVSPPWVTPYVYPYTYPAYPYQYWGTGDVLPDQYPTTCEGFTTGCTTTITNTPGTSWYTLPPCDLNAPVHVYTNEVA